MTRSNSYELGLDKNEANFVALSPLTFLARSAYVYPDGIAMIHGDRQYSWKETYARRNPATVCDGSFEIGGVAKLS